MTAERHRRMHPLDRRVHQGYSPIIRLGFGGSVRVRAAESYEMDTDLSEIELMTCYQRHLRPLFETLGLEYEGQSRERIDAAIRRVLRLSGDATCPQIWSALKALPPEEFESLASRVSESLSEPGAV